MLDRLADPALVLVGVGGVDVAVAQLEGGADGPFGGGVAVDLVDAEADLGDLKLVVEGEVELFSHFFLLCFA